MGACDLIHQQGNAPTAFPTRSFSLSFWERASLFSLSLWERVGVRAVRGHCITWHPHPAFGHPLPEGEGYSYGNL